MRTLNDYLRNPALDIQDELESGYVDPDAYTSTMPMSTDQTPTIDEMRKSLKRIKAMCPDRRIDCLLLRAHQAKAFRDAAADKMKLLGMEAVLSGPSWLCGLPIYEANSEYEYHKMLFELRFIKKLRVCVIKEHPNAND